LSDIGDSQATHEVEPMDFHRSGTDVQLIRDFPIVQTIGNISQDLLLAAGNMRGVLLILAALCPFIS
jgi:hypothetical protein